jgi:glycosyltransferase involved in cell wall biosynthesis
MIIISCSGKFHNFALAEQLQRQGLLTKMYTTIALQKNYIIKNYIRRKDNENISPALIETNILLGFFIKIFPKFDYLWNELFDYWVLYKVKKQNNFKIFIGWSGMSSLTFKYLSKKGCHILILERGSAHILFQDKLLRDEYKKFNKNFSINLNVIRKEIIEYQIANIISIPSLFVKETFLKYDIPHSKLFVNHYGSSFNFDNTYHMGSKKKFTLLYLGAVTIQKGLIYLFKALNELNISQEHFEFWCIGTVSSEMKQYVDYYKKSNWIFWGYISHSELPNIISKADVGICPSIQDGFAMVVPQLLSCGIPVILSENTGAKDIINDGENGYIVNTFSSESISEKIEYLYQNPSKLKTMKKNALMFSQQNWNQYGDRYISMIKSIL